MQLSGVFPWRQNIGKGLDGELPAGILQRGRREHPVDALRDPFRVEHADIPQGFVPAVRKHQAQIVQTLRERLLISARR